MGDVFSKEKRSDVMSKIRSKNSKPELLIRSFLFSNGFRFRIHNKKLPGKPDIVLKKWRTVIFVHGCFWHGHEDCTISHMPKSNEDYWEPKINGNITRDTVNKNYLEADGWKVIIVWECEIRNKNLREQRLLKLVDEITLPIS